LKVAAPPPRVDAPDANRNFEEEKTISMRDDMRARDLDTHQKVNAKKDDPTAALETMNARRCV
jgi:hypothetical protein